MRTSKPVHKIPYGFNTLICVRGNLHGSNRLPSICNAEKIPGERNQSGENTFRGLTTFRPGIVILNRPFRLEECIDFLGELIVERCSAFKVKKLPGMILLRLGQTL